MMDARPQFVTAGRTLRMALLLPAAALIFLGSVIQLGMLGYGQLNARTLWPVMMIFQSAWDLLAAHFHAPEMDSLAKFWPLLLVVCGLSILVALRPTRRHRARQFEIRRRAGSW